jgi:hypothetical protein
VSVRVQIEEDQVLASPPAVTREVLPVDLEPGPHLPWEQCCRWVHLRPHGHRVSAPLEDYLISGLIQIKRASRSLVYVIATWPSCDIIE